jgi:hypothetical protein
MVCVLSGRQIRGLALPATTEWKHLEETYYCSQILTVPLSPNGWSECWKDFQIR